MQKISPYYSLIRNNYKIDSIPYVGYGIRYNCNGITVICEDISSNLTDVIGLITLCNRLNLSFIHFSDVIDDFLTDLYFDKQKAANAVFLFCPRGLGIFPKIACMASGGT